MVTQVSVFRRHYDFFCAILAAALIAGGVYLGYIVVSDIPIRYIGGAFIGLFTGSVALLAFFQKYSSVIYRAKNQDKIQLINSVFNIPSITSGLGIIYSTLLALINIQVGNFLGSRITLFIVSFQYFILFFLLFYSVLSFYAASSFIRRVMIGESSEDQSNLQNENENSSTDQSRNGSAK